MKKKKEQFVKSPDSITKALYEVISGEKNQRRDWDFFLYLFNSNARLLPYELNSKNNFELNFLSPLDYQNTIGKWLESKRETGFFEYEMNKTITIFGNIAHVFSSYESFHSKTDDSPYMRGINSFQLLFDKNRWWILNILWMRETVDHPIPIAYLKSIN